MFHLAICLSLIAMPFHGGAQAPATASAEPVSIKRVYALADKDTFTIKATLEVGSTAEITSDIIVKIDKLADDKKANAVLSVANYKSTMDNGEEPEPFNAVLDEHGMGDAFTEHGNQIVFSIFEVLSFVPGSSLKPGDDYSFDLKLSNGSITGKGKLKEVKDVEGKKVAFLEWTCTVSPPGGGDVDMKVKSQVDAATGKVLKSDAELLQGAVTGTISLEAKKKAVN